MADVIKVSDRLPELDGCPVRSGAQRFGDVCCIEGPQRSWSYTELDREVEALVQNLVKVGVKPGHRLIYDGVELVRELTFCFACIRIGATFVPINPRFPLRYKQQLVESVQPNWKVTDELVSACPHTIESEPEGVVTGIFTSGSSGMPKLAMHTLGNHFYSALGSQSVLPLHPGCRWALTLPLFHIAGVALVFRCLWFGATIVIPEDRAISPEWLTQRLISHVSLVATQLVRWKETCDPSFLVNHLKRLSGLLLGGSMIPSPVLQWLVDARIPAWISYGLTEMSSQVMTGPVNPDGVLQTLLPYRDIKISEHHEICVRGKTLFAGYYENGRISRPGRDKSSDDGWFTTGDLGILIEGNLQVLGRRNNQFISGGENVLPEQVESVMCSVFNLKECYVVARDDAEFGHRGVCFLFQDDLSEDARLHFRARLKADLPSYAIPVALYDLTDAYGKNCLPGGLKISRKALVELLYSGQAKPVC
ncbi:MAG: AMP-binding protein [Pseudomonadales bacterium]|nr:AMP-binding protein [Pseudomonadales bacterium]